MKVIILVRILWPAGAAKIALREAEVLGSQGHEVEVIFLRGGASKAYAGLLSRVHYRILSETGDSLLSPAFEWLSHASFPQGGPESRVDLNMILRFPGDIRSTPPDLLVCHDQWAGLAGLLCKKLLGVPYIVFLHEKLWRYPTPVFGSLAGRAERLVLSNAESVQSITEKVADSAYSKHGIRVVANCIGIDTGPPSDEAPKRERQLITVSHWDSERRPEVYLDILEALPSYRLVFVGKWRLPSDRARFLRLIRSKGLDSRVTMFEDIPENLLGALYADSTYLVRFGFGENGIATSVTEAIGHRLPVIINEELGSARMVSDYGAGVVLKSVSGGNVKDAIERIETIGEYARLVRGTEQLAQICTWEAHCNNLIRYSPLVASRR